MANNADTKEQTDHLQLIEFIARLRFQDSALHKQLIDCIADDNTPIGKAIQQIIIDADLLPFSPNADRH